LIRVWIKFLNKRNCLTTLKIDLTNQQMKDEDFIYIIDEIEAEKLEVEHILQLFL
jgi:hypothetical protein